MTNEQTINVTLFNLDDGLGVRDLVIPMTVLIGDTNGNGIVNSSDVSQAKSATGQPLATANFRADVTVSGNVDASDVSAVKLHSGTALPTAVAARQAVVPRLPHKTARLP